MSRHCRRTCIDFFNDTRLRFTRRSVAARCGALRGRARRCTPGSSLASHAGTSPARACSSSRTCTRRCCCTWPWPACVGTSGGKKPDPFRGKPFEANAAPKSNSKSVAGASAKRCCPIEQKQQQEPNVPSLGRKEPSSEVKSDSVLCHEHASSSKSERCVGRRRNSHDFPLTLGIEMANCVLAEADALVGDAQRAP